MPAPAKCGRAYTCRFNDCDWKGTWADGQEHIARSHLEEVPYHCLPCDYRAASQRDISHHTKKCKTHEKRVEGYTGLIVAYHPDIDVGSHLAKLSAEESQKLWSQRSRAKAPSSGVVTKRKRSPSPKARSCSSSSSSSSSTWSSSNSSSSSSSDSTIIMPVKKPKPSTVSSAAPTNKDSVSKEPPAQTVSKEQLVEKPKPLSKSKLPEQPPNDKLMVEKCPKTPTPGKPLSKDPLPETTKPIQKVATVSTDNVPPTFILPKPVPTNSATDNTPATIVSPKPAPTTIATDNVPTPPTTTSIPVPSTSSEDNVVTTLTPPPNPAPPKASHEISQNLSTAPQGSEQTVPVSDVIQLRTESALSEGAFEPNYEDVSETGSEAPKTVLPPTLTLDRETVHQLIERPNPVASANAAVARQLVMTNHHLVNVTEKLGSDPKGQVQDDHKVLVQIESHLAAIDKKLKKQQLDREAGRPKTGALLQPALVIWRRPLEPVLLLALFC